MDETLESVKARISERYLGKAGIHAVGVRRSANAITVYVESTEDAQQEETQSRTLENLRREAVPFAVVKKEAVAAKFA
jgi:preprotein translocase subunit SecD